MPPRLDTILAVIDGSMTTKILHGAEDNFAPPAHARHTAEIIPGASLTLLEGHGHLSLIQQIPALAASLI